MKFFLLVKHLFQISYQNTCSHLNHTTHLSLFQFRESNWSNSRIYRTHLLHLSSLPPPSCPLFSSLLFSLVTFRSLPSVPLPPSLLFSDTKSEDGTPKNEDGESENGSGFGIVDEEAKFWSEILYLWLPGEYNARLD